MLNKQVVSHRLQSAKHHFYYRSWSQTCCSKIFIYTCRREYNFMHFFKNKNIMYI